MTRAMKDSGIEWIGQIPENWNVKKNKYDIKYIKGKNPANTNIDGIGSPYIGASDLDSQRDYELFTTDDIPACQVDDILILWDGARAGLIGRNHQGKIASTVTKLEISSNIYSPFFYWYLKGFEKFLADMVGGTTIPHMSRKYIEDIFFLTIPYTEQQKIADYLDKRCEKIDTAIDNQKQIIEKLKEYKQSLITETVTKGLNPNVKLKDSGIEWIGSIPEHWEIKKLKYLFKFKKNIAGKEGFDILSVTQSGIKIKDISTNEGQIAQDYSKYQIVNIDDFIMNHMDLLTGFVDCSHFNGVTSPDYRVFCQIEPTTNSNLYYNYIFQQCYKNKIFYGLGQGVSGLGRWRLPSDMFLNFTLPQPPLSEQKEIAEYLDKKCNRIDEAIKQKEETISKLEEYKKSLIFECVTGKKEVA